MKGKNVMKNKISGKIVALLLTLFIVATSGMPLYAKETEIRQIVSVMRMDSQSQRQYHFLRFLRMPGRR